jgi:tetratricopeptide (TPR) repeat protein
MINHPSIKAIKMATRSMRSKAAAFGVGLDVDRLEQLLCHTLLRYTNDVDLVTLISKFEGLAARCHLQGLESCHDELINAATMLAISLSASPVLPALIVYEVHSAIGLIREAQGQYTCAIQSYLKAFWVASATSKIPQEELGCVLHRLGKAYGRSGKYQKGMILLEEAIGIYEKAHLNKEKCVEEAREAYKVLAASRFPDEIARPKGKANRRAAFRAHAYSKQHADIAEHFGERMYATV